MTRCNSYFMELQCEKMQDHEKRCDPTLPNADMYQRHQAQGVYWRDGDAGEHREQEAA